MSWMAVLGALILILGTLACSPPEEELTSARASLEGAREAGAEAYAPKAWQQAQEALQAAEAEIEAQAGKSFVSRRYQPSRDLLQAAEETAGQAVQAAEQGRKQARREAEQGLEAAGSALESARSRLADLAACESKPKGFDQDLELLGGTLDGVEAELAEVETRLAAEEWAEARTQARAIEEELDAFAAEVDEAAAETGCS
jgi:hypothetical protein